MPLTFLNSLTFAKDHFRTFLGWTPGLRALVRGALLPCGCLAGSYETFAGDMVTVIDARGPACEHPAHLTDAVLWRGSSRLFGPHGTDDIAGYAGPDTASR